MFLAPVLSAQFITEATGKQFEIFSLIPFLPLPKHTANNARLDFHTNLKGQDCLSLVRKGVCLFVNKGVTYFQSSLIDSVFNNK